MPRFTKTSSESRTCSSLQTKSVHTSTCGVGSSTRETALAARLATAYVAGCLADRGNSPAESGACPTHKPAECRGLPDRGRRMVEVEADAAAGEVAPGAGSLCCRVNAFQRTGPSSCMLSSTHIDLHAAFGPTQSLLCVGHGMPMGLNSASVTCPCRQCCQRRCPATAHRRGARHNHDGQGEFCYGQPTSRQRGGAQPSPPRSARALTLWRPCKRQAAAAGPAAAGTAAASPHLSTSRTTACRGHASS